MAAATTVGMAAQLPNRAGPSGASGNYSTVSNVDVMSASAGLSTAVEPRDFARRVNETLVRMRAVRAGTAAIGEDTTLELLLVLGLFFALMALAIGAVMILQKRGCATRAPHRTAEYQGIDALPTHL